jgi:hypothetical protein
MVKHKIKYQKYPSGYEGVIEVDGFRIAEDKCAYECNVCGAIYMSKNIDCRSVFRTDDPRSPCSHIATGIFSEMGEPKLTRICKCEPIIH